MWEEFQVTTMTIQIRKAQAEDADSVASLIQELAQGIHERSPITPEYVRQYLTSTVSRIFLAVDGDEVLGMLSYSISDNLYHASPACLIEELVVRSTARDRGVGSALVEAVLEEARNLHCAEISVSTMPDNEGAIRFYRRHGFTEEAVFLEHHFKY